MSKAISRKRKTTKHTRWGGEPGTFRFSLSFSHTCIALNLSVSWLSAKWRETQFSVLRFQVKWRLYINSNICIHCRKSSAKKSLFSEEIRVGRRCWICDSLDWMVNFQPSQLYLNKIRRLLNNCNLLKHDLQFYSGWVIKRQNTLLKLISAFWDKFHLGYVFFIFMLTTTAAIAEIN